MSCKNLKPDLTGHFLCTCLNKSLKKYFPNTPDKYNTVGYTR
jgi:hypothetical protein